MVCSLFITLCLESFKIRLIPENMLIKYKLQKSLKSYVMLLVVGRNKANLSRSES